MAKKIAKEAPPYAAAIEKEASSLQVHFAGWLREKTGITPADYEDMDELFDDAIKLSVALRMKHQASPENKARRGLEDDEDATEDKAPPKKAGKAAKASKAKASPVDDDEDEDEPEPPKKPAKAKRTTGKPAF